MADWHLPNRIERQYARAMSDLFGQLNARLKGIDDPHEIVRRIKRFAEYPQFQRHVESIARVMTTQVNNSISSTWRASARRAGRGNEIYLGIMRDLRTAEIGDSFFNTVYANAEHIKTFPFDIAQELNDFIQAETIKGRRASSIAEELIAKHERISESRIRLIARTEVSKTQTALTRARAENLGLDWYVWRTSEDSRVRSAHAHMANVLVRWRDAPMPEAMAPAAPDNSGIPRRYHAGEIFNCRCYPEPVVSVDFLTFPMRVHQSGSIRKMTKANFESLGS